MLVAAATLTLGSCQGPGYGGKGVSVSINVEISEAVPASSSDEEPTAPKIQGWVLDLDDWVTLKGKDQFAELKRLSRLKGADEKAAKSHADLRSKLISSMDRNRVTTFGSTKVKKRLPKDTLWFVVGYQGELTYDKFDTVVQRTVTIRM